MLLLLLSTDILLTAKVRTLLVRGWLVTGSCFAPLHSTPSAAAAASMALTLYSFSLSELA